MNSVSVIPHSERSVVEEVESTTSTQYVMSGVNTINIQCEGRFPGEGEGGVRDSDI